MKPPLTLTPEEMRRAGYAVIDRIVAHLEQLPEDSPWGRGEPPAPNPFRKPPPEKGRGFEDVMADLDAHLFPHNLRVNHPNFYSFVPGPGNFIGALGDALASGFNIFAGSWLGAPGGAEMERATIYWVRDALGFSEDAGGLFTSGGSAANIIALATARHRLLGTDLAGARAYTSAEVHASVDKAMRLLGFAPGQLVKIPTDTECRMDGAPLARAIAADRAAGLKPFCVIASSGTTNTGAVDPLHEIAEICAREAMWMHVDGAYGACAAFSARGKAALSGIERADSVSFDPHKWLFQPFEIGGVLVRDARLLHDAFDVSASYMRDTKGLTRGVNFCEYGHQLTRSLRALKLWMTFQVFGADEIARAIENGFAMAEAAEAALEALPHWRLISRASMGIVSFRAAPEGWSDDQCDGLTAEIASLVRREGRDMIATTVLDGRVALRMCPINPQLTAEAVAATIARLDSHLRAVMA